MNGPIDEKWIMEDLNRRIQFFDLEDITVFIFFNFFNFFPLSESFNARLLETRTREIVENETRFRKNSIPPSSLWLTSNVYDKMWRKLRDDRWIFDAVSFRLRDCGRGREEREGMAETVGKISLQRRGGTFYDSSAPRSFTVESEQNSFYRVGRGRVEGEGGELLRCLRGAAVQGLENKTIVAMSPRVLILARNGGGVAICGDVWTISLAIVGKKKMGREERFSGICWRLNCYGIGEDYFFACKLIKCRYIVRNHFEQGFFFFRIFFFSIPIISNRRILSWRWTN